MRFELYMFRASHFTIDKKFLWVLCGNYDFLGLLRYSGFGVEYKYKIPKFYGKNVGYRERFTCAIVRLTINR